METKILILHSDDWVKRESIALGENIPSQEWLNVETKSLPQWIKEILYECGGGFNRNYPHLKFGEDFGWVSHNAYGIVEIKLDEHPDKVTFKQLEKAFSKAVEPVLEKRIAYLLKQEAKVYLQEKLKKAEDRLLFQKALVVDQEKLVTSLQSQIAELAEVQP